MRTIVVALDGSPRAEGVLRAAIALAHAHAGSLVLLRSIGLPADVPQDLWQLTDRPLLDELKDRAGQYLAQCEERVPAGIRGERRVEVGSPWETICRVAGSLPADLVVIGSHGYGGIDRLLGTTAAKVVNHCACSVLVVKDATTSERA
ncbi:MAG: universal stress protein [Polyangiaceae bacterium]|nr:universal stress protein [Polyangiaceae bacterium]